MTTSTTRTPLYNLWSRCPEDQLPPEMAAFFMAGALPPEKRRTYAVFCFCRYYPANPRRGTGRWPCRVGRGQSAGGLRLG